jgi:asparagine synthase (glutamine-hydrolysing)
MSGFVAIINTDGSPVERGLLEKLATSLHFRGPDQKKTWISGSVGFGHALLRTTYEAQYETQPASLDGQVWLIGCIRIDGRKELIDALNMKKGLPLRTTPDSELILHAYHKWGTECLNYLLGDFSFVIWDGRKKQLFCARDRFGMRQLCYSRKEGLLLISNSINCLLQHPEVTRVLDDKAIGDFLLFGSHTWLNKTISAFADISVLPAAHKLVYANEKLSAKKYWEVAPDLPLLRYQHEHEYLEHFREVFSLAVADRTRAASVVVSLSGGLDSSAIAATLCTLQEQNQIPPTTIHTVTAVYDYAHPDEERYYTGLVASHLGLPTCFIPGDSYPMMQGGMTTTRPIEFETPDYWRAIKHQIAKYGRVVLTGASADNLLECSTARAALRDVNPIRVFLEILRLRMRYGKFPPLGTGVLAKLRGTKRARRNVLSGFTTYPDFFDPEFEINNGLRERWSEWLNWQAESLNARQPSAHSSLVGADWNTDDLFMNPDFTLALERDPFLDLRVLEFVFSIPTLPWLFQKHILRRAMAPLLPQKTIMRPKTPLGDLARSLSTKPENSWITDWTPSDNLSKYIRTTHKSKTGVNGGDADFLKYRLIYLDRWIGKIK